MVYFFLMGHPPYFMVTVIRIGEVMLMIPSLPLDSLFLGSHLISLASGKQRVVSRSSTEAKYRALAAATSEMTWIEHLIREIGCYTTSFPILWYDNLSATYLTSNPIFHFRTKHMDTNFHFVHDKVRAKILSVRYVSSHDQVVDALTKPLSKV